MSEIEKRVIPFSPPDISEAEILEVAKTLESGWITTGPRTKLLERRIAAFIGTGRTDIDCDTPENKEKDWERMGIKLTRATMANWVNRCSDDYFTPLIKHMRGLLLRRDVLHADETPVQVLKEPGKKPQTKPEVHMHSKASPGAISFSKLKLILRT